MLTRVILLLCSVFFTACAQNQAASRVDEILKDWNKPGTPGASVAVIRDGKIVFQKGYGSANLEYGVAVTADTIFHVASVSKQFTAMALVLLEQDRKLSIDDDVVKYLPELAHLGQKITVRNLLQHTSGIRDQWQTLALAGWRLDDVITQQQILRMMFRQKELNFAPGTEHLYSNGGYTLAAEIVARVSGKPFPVFCKERIFVPLGMASTHFHDDLKLVVPNRAYSYDKAGGGFENAPLNYANAGATSLFTTAPDLAKWLDNFRDPKVGGRAGIERLQEQAVLADGRKIAYALGVSVATQRGLRAVSHSGGDAGFRSHVVWFPDERLGVVVLSNLGSFNPARVANDVAGVFLGAKEKAEVVPPARFERTYIPFGGLAGDGEATAGPAGVESAAADELAQYCGAYWSEELETQYTIFARGGKLIADHVRHGEIQLSPAGKDKFSATPWFFQQVTFTRDPSGRIAGLTVGGGRVRGIRFTRR